MVWQTKLYQGQPVPGDKYLNQTGQELTVRAVRYDKATLVFVVLELVGRGKDSRTIINASEWDKLVLFKRVNILR